MSLDEASSRVTYTSISSDYEEPSDVGSPGVIVYGYDGLPMHPSGDDADDEDEEEASEEDEDVEEEEEHLPPANSTAAASPVVDLVPSAAKTEPFETDESAATPPPPPAYRTTTRMSIRAQTPIPFPSEAKVDRLLAIPTPPPSPLTSLSSPLPRIPSPPFPVPSPPTTSPTYTKAPLGYRAARIRLRTASPPSLPLSSPLPLPPPIILPCTRASMVLMRAVAPLCIAPGPRFEVGESSSAAAARSTGGFRADYGFVGTLDVEIRRDLDRDVGYGITDVWVDPAEAVEEIPPTTLAELSQRVIDTNVRHDTYEIYVRLDDAQSDRSLITGQLNVLRKDRRYHTNIALLVERKARVAREAWAQSMDANHRECYEVVTLRTTVSALKTENEELRAADRRRQTQLLETLTQVRALQTRIVVLQRQRTEDSDRLTQHIQQEHNRFREFQRTRDVTLEDADSSS
ncbi:hypothetical protein Tco_0653362 [Tanacetum coccineum]|uniref:Uncharacterized protein n=1 Tax=Tanacetum coccineum TaxID=301880 RepID=A0ABQ4X0G6_9ASTR